MSDTDAFPDGRAPSWVADWAKDDRAKITIADLDTAAEIDGPRADRSDDRDAAVRKRGHAWGFGVASAAAIACAMLRTLCDPNAGTSQSECSSR